MMKKNARKQRRRQKKLLLPLPRLQLEWRIRNSSPSDNRNPGVRLQTPAGLQVRWRCTRANVGGAVDSDGVPLEPGNPPRFCLFTWIAVIEGVCPAVALTLRAAFSAQATSTAVERTFSQAGLSSSDRRTDLKSDTLCRHIYLRMNEEHLPSLDEACEEYCNRHGHKHAKEAGGGSSSAVV